MNFPRADQSTLPPSVCTRDTVQILNGIFDAEQLRQVIECLEEDGHRCATFDEVEGAWAAPADPHTCLHLIGNTKDRDSCLVKRFRAGIENTAGVPILAYLQGCPAAGEKEMKLLSAEERELFLGKADDFLLAPLSLYDMRLRVNRLVRHFTEREDSVRDSQSNLISQLGMQQFIGSSPAFVRSIEKIPRIASFDATVLIMGNTGTGKEMCARAIHYLSPRAKSPFVPVNCGSIPPELFENEMFGHETGAYTDARQSRRGLVAEAEGGTLFLDEVDSLPLAAQVKILRFLQDKQYRPLGTTHYRQANTRLIAASNQDLQQKVREHTFREDLYYRLKVISLSLPALRERPEDIAPLALHFLRMSGIEYHCEATQLSQDSIEKLREYNWPGNVRELENVIRQAALTVSGMMIRARDIVLATDTPPPSASAIEPLKAAKARVVENFATATSARRRARRERTVGPSSPCSKSTTSPRTPLGRLDPSSSHYADASRSVLSGRDFIRLS